jgi:hypothetical protein
MNIEEIEIMKTEIMKLLTLECKDCEHDVETCAVECLTEVDDLSEKLNNATNELAHEQAREAQHTPPEEGIHMELTDEQAEHIQQMIDIIKNNIRKDLEGLEKIKNQIEKYQKENEAGKGSHVTPSRI